MHHWLTHPACLVTGTRPLHTKEGATVPVSASLSHSAVPPRVACRVLDTRRAEEKSHSSAVGKLTLQSTQDEGLGYPLAKPWLIWPRHKARHVKGEGKATHSLVLHHT